MNILILTSEYPCKLYPRKDYTSVVAFFAREWKKQGHNVMVVVNSSRFPSILYFTARAFKNIILKIKDVSEDFYDKSWSRQFFFEDEGIIVHNFPMKKILPGGNYSTSVLKKQVIRIRKLLNEYAFTPDVITGHWINPQLRLVSMLKKEYPFAKTAVVMHSDYSKEKITKYKVSNYIDNIDHIGCRSKYACECVQNELSLKNAPFHCPSGVPNEYVEKCISSEEKIFDSEYLSIISAGRLVQYKCFDCLINAIQDIDKCKLVIAGDGPERDYLESLSNERVCFLGKISREELFIKMKNSAVFALISKHETFGLVYLEAMLQGCIVIASKNGGVDGIIQDGVNGFLCEEGNSEQLKTIIKTIIFMSQEDKKRISQNAISTAVNFTDSRVAEEYLKNIIN